MPSLTKFLLFSVGSEASDILQSKYTNLCMIYENIYHINMVAVETHTTE